VVLFNHVVQEFGLPDLNVSFTLRVVAFDRRRVGAALVNRDLPRV